MTALGRRHLVRAAVIAAVCAGLGFGGILDPTHAALLGCLVFAGLSARFGRPDPADAEWPAREFRSRAGGRNAVSDLAWQVFDIDRRVDRRVVDRVRALVRARLVPLGVDADDPAARPELERLLGGNIAAGLASGRRPTARTLQTWLDAIDRLGPADERIPR